MNEWQPIDTAPKDGTVVLLYGIWAGEIHGPARSKAFDIGSFQDGRSDFPGNDWWVLGTGDYYECWMRPTHWMPLPEPPKD